MNGNHGMVEFAVNSAEGSRCTKTGLSVVTAFQTVTTEAQALLAIETFAPQMALVDCSLSRHGPEFAVADALSKAGVSFIFTSGHDRRILPVRHRGRDFLAKPFSLEELESAILRIRADTIVEEMHNEREQPTDIQ